MNELQAGIAKIQADADELVRLRALNADMLKALRAIHYYVTVRDPNRGELFLGTLHQVEAAIAKAEGQP